MSRSRYTPEQKQHPVTQWRHSGRYAQSMPKDWSGGTLVTDDYAGYNALHARPWLNEFRAWLQTTQAQTAPNSGLRKAIDYPLKRWSALVCYLDDGRVPIDNNRAENALRGVTVGRKNWLFAGLLPERQRAAMIMILLESAKASGYESWFWLRDVLTRLPAWPNNRLNELLP